MNNNLQSPFGRIDMDVLKMKELNSTAKVLYALLASKQGETNYVLARNKALAASFGCSADTIERAKSALTKAGIITKNNKYSATVHHALKQYGGVEFKILATPSISINAKYLYIIYCSASNNDDASCWGKDGVTKTFKLGGSTYTKALKELKELGLVSIEERFYDGEQLSNKTIVVRADSFKTSVPVIWSEGMQISPTVTRKSVHPSPAKESNEHEPLTRTISHEPLKTKELSGSVAPTNPASDYNSVSEYVIETIKEVYGVDKSYWTLSTQDEEYCDTIESVNLVDHEDDIYNAIAKQSIPNLKFGQCVYLANIKAISHRDTYQ